MVTSNTGMLGQLMQNNQGQEIIRNILGQLYTPDQISKFTPDDMQMVSGKIEGLLNDPAMMLSYRRLPTDGGQTPTQQATGPRRVITGGKAVQPDRPLITHDKIYDTGLYS